MVDIDIVAAPLREDLVCCVWQEHIAPRFKMNWQARFASRQPAAGQSGRPGRILGVFGKDGTWEGG